mgnify:CR=1 FL=1|jgi:hypothetical protein
MIDEINNEIEAFKEKIIELEKMRSDIENEKLTILVEMDEDKVDYFIDAFPWAFDNDIVMFVDDEKLQIPHRLKCSYPQRGPFIYMRYHFKNEEDLVAFKLRWL